MSRKHHVSFDAHKKVSVEVPVKFQTKEGSVSFEAVKKVSKPVHVGFMAQNKSK